MWELFPGTCSLHSQSNKKIQVTKSVTTHWLRNINLIPIHYGFRPRVRGRLTLLRLTLSRNPWTFGERASHPFYRYSCLHSHFRYLHDQLPDPSQAYGTLRYRAINSTRSFGTLLDPRYIFGTEHLN